MTVKMADDANKLKEEGNVHFKNGNYVEALSYYTKALNLNPKGGNDTSTYLKNRAACYLKVDKYTEAVVDCTNALEICPNDPKTLFRRCQAYMGLDKYEDAYKDVIQVRQLDPKNSAIQPVLQKLTPIIQAKLKEMESTDHKVKQMIDLTFGDENNDPEKKKTAAQNLIVLAREEAGAEKIFKSGGVNNLIRMLEMEKDKDMKIVAIRVLACLSKDNKERALSVYNQLGLKRISTFIGIDNEDVSTAMSNVLQNIILAVTQLEAIKQDKEAHEEKRKKQPELKLRPFPFTAEKLTDEANRFLDEVMPVLFKMLPNAKVSRYGRDNIMELLIKLIPRKDGVGWSFKMVAHEGVKNLLEVAGTINEHKTLKVSEHSRMTAALCLQKSWDDLLSDRERERYREAVNEHFTELFSDEILESKLEAVMALAALLQGPYEVGSHILGREGVLEMILSMADSGNAIYTKYAIEALVHSASKKERCSGVIKQATPILKQLYQSSDDGIKVRALVGLCKLGSFGGADISAKTFAEGSNTTLAKACRKFLCNPAKDIDLRKWAAEGLAYLTLDADVKEDLVDDIDALKSLFDLTKIKDRTVVYPVAQSLVNTTNSYDKKDPEPELVELAKFAKQHVPEEHDKDKEPYISERVKKLVKAGVVNALVNLCTNESENTKELLGRVFREICKEPSFRGLVVQQGGAKALLPLSLDGTDKGKIIAAHALAKIAVTNDPTIAFPGQRSCEVVRPILQLLHPEREGLENFEALLALCNLSSVNNTVRQRIVKEKGIPAIEHYCFEEHPMLRRAATECMCNLAQCNEVQQFFKGENDRVKMMVLFCGEAGEDADEEDERLVLAASGCLAILSDDTEICEKIVKSTEKYLECIGSTLVKPNTEVVRRGAALMCNLVEKMPKVANDLCTPQWVDILGVLAAHEKPEIQFRGVYIINQIIQVNKELASKVVASSLLEVLMACSKLPGEETVHAKECANEALNKCVEHGLIQHRT